MSKGQRIGYVRVSTVDQNAERQLEGLALDKVFTDQASGKDTKRPQLQAALDYAREADTLIIHSMDRLARNTEDLLRMVRELTSRGVAVEFVKERLMFSGNSDEPMAHLMMTMLGGFAQFERALIRERQREGIALAKAKGDVYKGRKPSLTKAQIAEVQQRASKGESKARLAASFGVARQTIYNALGRHRSTL
ncbi:recombinase family protein [Caballeronia sp. LP003]|uniref:recombinase family protein n=1 Tax=Caballeronia sp. LP003 TaxID=3038551 RepID=UPI002857C5FC|nr:recombinase family protein [Caballeronia sp. LP003]MDR5785948.1 recombinase family protein [Caballeronia sp. LP003]